ncbi:MAG TPA: hypothetical protein VMT03_02190 [Polyangia bacterium]|nr:hypothetical protein [Polyangia bacterium]
MSKPKLVSLLTLAAAAGFALAIFTAPGCASRCGENCPITTVYISSPDNAELNGILQDLEVQGDACPPGYGVYCNGDEYSTGCTHVTVTAMQPGECDVLFVFNDRPNEIVHLQFGPTRNANGSCCKGYPVLGPWLYTIPDKPTGGTIYSGGGDAGPIDTDAVTVVTDAAATTTTDGGTDAADAGADAGAD